MNVDIRYKTNRNKFGMPWMSWITTNSWCSTTTAIATITGKTVAKSILAWLTFSFVLLVAQVLIYQIHLGGIVNLTALPLRDATNTTSTELVHAFFQAEWCTFIIVVITSWKNYVNISYSQESFQNSTFCICHPSSTIMTPQGTTARINSIFQNKSAADTDNKASRIDAFVVPSALNNIYRRPRYIYTGSLQQPGD